MLRFSLFCLALIWGLVASAQSRTENVFDAWIAVCQQANTEAEPVCFMRQTLTNGEGNPLAEVRIYRLTNDEGVTVNTLQVRTPLGVLLQAGVGVEVDEEAVAQAAYVVCADACIAEAQLDDAVLDAMADGFFMSLTIRHVEAPEPIVMPSDLTGFGDARAHISQ